MRNTVTRSIAAIVLAVSAATGVAACGSTVPEAPTATPAALIQEDDPRWDWRTMGNRCHGLGGAGVADDVLECAQYPTDPDLLNRSGNWTFIDESGTWVFCPSGRSDLECGA